MTDEPLSGQTAVVTGASAGIGRETARVLAHEAAGHLVYVASYAGQQPRAYDPVYAASKWWMCGFAKSVSSQVGEENVRRHFHSHHQLLSSLARSRGVDTECRR